MSTSEGLTKTESEVEADRWDRVRELPPSAKLVAKVLDYEETLTQSQIAEETLLPARTVRYDTARGGRRRHLSVLLLRRAKADLPADDLIEGAAIGPVGASMPTSRARRRLRWPERGVVRWPGCDVSRTRPPNVQIPDRGHHARG
jgi:hypothetical protein